MTKKLEEAIERLRSLPEGLQDNAAQEVIRFVEEEMEPGDREAINEGRRDLADGKFVTLDQWRHDVGDRHN